MSETTTFRPAARFLADSFLFRNARRDWELNRSDYQLRLSRFQKLAIGGYLVLKDYSEGAFPPTHADREQTFAREKDLYDAKPGVELERSAYETRKTPFWLDPKGIDSLESYIRILRRMLDCGVQEGARVLELGCGAGWMSEFLAASGCHCVGTSINEFEVESARHRVAIVESRDVGGTLTYETSTMETVGEQFADQPRFDFVIIHAALHHAFSWREALESVSSVLQPGGWFLICNEPNLIHTVKSYRVAKIDHTHEIGMSGRAIRGHLLRSGFDEVKNFGPRGILQPIWLAARRG